MRILDEATLTADMHAFAVEIEIGEGPGEALVRELWETALDKGVYGVPHALVVCDGDEAWPAALRASLERFNEAAEDGRRWTAHALSAHLLSDLCGITVDEWRYPPNRGICVHGNAYATDGGTVRWLGGECAACIANDRPSRLQVGGGDRAARGL